MVVKQESRKAGKGWLARRWRHQRQETIIIIVLLAMIVNLALSILIETQKQAELHGQGASAACFITGGANRASCFDVTTSEYGWTLGISNSLIGIIAFCAMTLLMFGAAIPWLTDTHLRLLLKGVTVCLCLGSAWGLYLLGVQAFVLHEYCTFCVIVDSITILSTALLTFGLRVFSSD